MSSALSLANLAFGAECDRGSSWLSREQLRTASSESRPTKEVRNLPSKGLQKQIKILALWFWFNAENNGVVHYELRFGFFDSSWGHTAVTNQDDDQQLTSLLLRIWRSFFQLSADLQPCSSNFPIGRTLIVFLTTKAGLQLKWRCCNMHTLQLLN